MHKKPYKDVFLNINYFYTFKIINDGLLDGSQLLLSIGMHSIKIVEDIEFITS